MKRPWLIIALLLSVGVNIGILATLGIARARGPRPMSGGFEQTDADRGPRMERLAEWLRLEGDKREQFLDQHRQFFERLQRTKRELMETRRELRAEVGAHEPDRQRIDELLTRSARLTAELDRAFVDNVLVTREILDGRQQRAYFGLLGRLRDRGDRAGDRGRRSPGNGPPRQGPGPPI